MRLAHGPTQSAAGPLCEGKSSEKWASAPLGMWVLPADMGRLRCDERALFDESGLIMFAKALLAFMACPGMVAMAVPLGWLALEPPLQSVWRPGLALIAIGLVGLLWCVRDFYVTGKGTLAPWAPPSHLVTVGLYRFSRNPMYVSVSLMLFGWALSFGSQGLLAYATVVAVAFHCRIVLGEEPWLRRTFGESWDQYTSEVPRWLW